MTHDSIGSLPSLAEVAHTALDIFVIFDKDLNTLFVNDAVYDNLGYSVDEIMADPRATMEAIGAGDEVRCAIKSKVSRIPGILVRHTHKITKATVWLQTSITLYYQDGHFKYGVAIARNVTEARYVDPRIEEYESQIVQSREKFRLLFEHMNQGVIIVDPLGSIVDVNHAAEKITGTWSDKLIGSSIDAAFEHWRPLTEEGVPISPEDCVRMVTKAAGSAVTVNTLAIFNEAHNEYRWVVLDSILVEDKRSAEGPNCYVIIDDITAQRKSYELLKQSEQKFADSFRYLAVGMTIADLDGHLAEVNDAFCNMVGYTREELARKDTLLLTHPDDREETLKLLKRLRAGKISSFRVKKRYIHKQGHIIWVELSVSMVRLKDGRPQYLIGQIQDITSLKKAEDSLRETERVFRLAQNFARVGSWHWKIATGELKWSDSIFNIFGLSKKKDAISFDVFLDLIYPEDRPKVERAIELALANKRPYEVEHRIRHKSNKVRWILEKGTVICDSNGQPIEMYGVARDVTETRKTSEELKASRQLYQLLAESGQEIIALHGPDGRTLYTSPSIKSLLGYSPNDVAGEIAVWDLVHPDDMHAAKSLFATALKERNRGHHITLRVRRKKGDYLWCTTAIKAIEGADGSITLRSLTWSVQAQVETDEKLRKAHAELVGSVERYKELNRKLESTLRELNKRTRELARINKKLLYSQSRLRQVNDQLKLRTNALNQMAIIVSSDRNGNICEVNNQFLRITGYKKKEVLGKRHCIFWESMFNSGVHDRAFFDAIWQKLQAGLTWRGEICNRAKTGRLFWLLKTIVPLVDSTGAITSFYSFSIDITGQKTKEKELMEAKQTAEEASAIKEEFLSVMSHEIRTPLNSVIGLSNLLLKKNPREDQLTILETLKSSSDNLLYLVNDILDYSKIKTRNIRLEEVKFDILDMIRQLQSSYQPIAEEKGLEFSITAAPDLPRILEGDVTRLNQILNNLINNAIKFTSRGEVRVRVILKPGPDGSQRLHFEIADTGIGISEKQMPLLFTPFHQAERNIARKFGGTGLGLSIVKGLIDLFHGEINVKSQAGEGTVFSFWIPIRIVRLRSKAKTRNVKTDFLRQMNILYVEDVESNQLLVKNILEECGANCIIAPSGKSALSITQKLALDIILMDLQMPGLNGYEVTRKIRRQRAAINRDTPVIAFTAEPYSQILKDKIRAAGIQDIITKPFKYEVLIDKIRKWVREAKVVSFKFYEEAFENDPVKLADVKAAILKEFKQFEKSFKKYVRQGNVTRLRREIHKLSPIAKNLECHELIELLDAYKTSEEVLDVSHLPNEKVLRMLKKICRDLGAIK
jgi:PAS domain S-box-containing protein